MSSTDASARPVIIFLHLPKTGGTTLQHIIRRQYPPHAVGTAYRQRATDPELDELARALPPGIAAVQGHLPFGLHKFLSREATYITLLREPVSRVVSHYHNILRDPTWRSHKRLRSEGTTLREFATSARFPGAANRQTRFLSGRGSLPEPCTADMLEAAKRNLRDHFSVVGLTERFDETLILLKRAFGWRSVLYDRKNADPNRTDRRSISGDTLEAIEDSNRFDLELYAYAREIFEGQLRGRPPGFDIELEAFRRVNRQYAGHPSILRV